MIIPIQRCKGCGRRFYNEEELVKCSNCNDKRIEIEAIDHLETIIIQMKRHIKGLSKAVEKLEKELK